MGNLFLIRIGRFSRRGNFEELLPPKAISASDSSVDEVRSFFYRRCGGLDVMVSEIKLVEEITTRIKAKPDKQADCLSDFKIMYTNAEKGLHNEYRELLEKAEKAKRELESLIADRYSVLFYADINRKNPIVLNTDYYGTTCEKLPIKGLMFMGAVEKCEDGIPVDMPSPDQDSDCSQSDDMPF
jgi:hypothetical protein